jgi:RNA polymerase sigma-70 factor (ECF subfamily)
MSDGVRERLDQIYRVESRRVLATLIRLLGDFDLAEEALHDAFIAAMERWPEEGEPANPRAWLVSAGRFKAIDHLRRRAVHDEKLLLLARDLEDVERAPPPDDHEFPDDRLRLIFTCCHPALAQDAKAALTLRTVCGLTTEEIARAYLVPAPTLAQRIVRAKNKIRDARIPYEVPARRDLPDRLDAVLQVIYLVFNEGYSASFGELVTRADLATEAIRLCRLLHELLPDPEAQGLLALMLLHDSRRTARTSADGGLVLLGNQNRALWNQAQITEGTALLQRSLANRRIGPYAVQAAIAALHAESPTAGDTDWEQIVELYNVLLRLAPTPVVELNRAVAKAMVFGPERGLALIDELMGRGELANYLLAHSARADLLRRLGRRAEARAAYEHALALATQRPERRFLESRIREMQDGNRVG